MGKIKSHVQDWLDKCGNDLGYSQRTAPKLKDLDVIRKNRLPVWQYYGYKSQEEYWDAKYGLNDEPHDLEDIEPIEY
tara:strand:- start:8006 stop:8236 length:231 start_codon:yes stop_codon:yes gene_type:complete